jgi:cell division protein FtsI (penicillin-binding protein 3)
MEGTGKAAALNGYSAGGKTGTAQKIDVLTHTYSKTMHVASFAGMAPVSNPAITVAVVIDSPSAGGSYYGAQVSAPVFQRVAQEVLEYLGVPHDQPLKTPQELLAAAPKATTEDGPSENIGDLNAIFEEANNLPKDDPLRTAITSPPGAAMEDGKTTASLGGQDGLHLAPGAVNLSQAPGSAGQLRQGAPPGVSGGEDTRSILAQAEPGAGSHALVAPSIAPAIQPRANGMIVVDASRRVAVPSFAGSALRAAVETAEGIGLRVAVEGSGVAREQAPAPGTLVPLGTEVVVRFAR